MEDNEYAFVKLKVLKLTGIDLSYYKSPQMRRRLQALIHRAGAPNWPAFFRSIQNDPVAIENLRNFLTINVSSFFRDPDKYTYLREVVIPSLLKTAAPLRIWSAGCSRGHEPYSLAMLLSGMSSLRRYQIIASDIDGAALDWARAGGPYSAEEVATTPAVLLNKHFQNRNGSFWFTDQSIRSKITFCTHNLLADPFTAPDEGIYDLIVCRNVVIYFTSEGKTRLYRQFHKLLRPGGLLFIGGTEIISGAPEIGFEPLSMSFYRRSLQPDVQPALAAHSGM